MARTPSYPFPILYNVEGDVARAYEVYSQAGYANPAVLVVDTSGSIVWQSKGTVSHRTPNSDIIAQLEKLS